MIALEKCSQTTAVASPVYAQCAQHICVDKFKNSYGQTPPSMRKVQVESQLFGSHFKRFIIRFISSVLFSFSLFIYSPITTSDTKLVRNIRILLLIPYELLFPRMPPLVSASEINKRRVQKPGKKQDLSQRLNVRNQTDARHPTVKTGLTLWSFSTDADVNVDRLGKLVRLIIQSWTEIGGNSPPTGLRTSPELNSYSNKQGTVFNPKQPFGALSTMYGMLLESVQHFIQVSVFTNHFKVLGSNLKFVILVKTLDFYLL